MTKGINKKIKVMHIAECTGGVDRYLRSLLKYMNHDKFENIVVLSQLYMDKGYESLADYVEIIDIKHGVGIKTLFSATYIRKIIKKYSPDIVYAHSSVCGAITRLANLGLKSKCIYNPHGWSFNMQSSKRGIYIALEKFMSPFCDAIVCISDSEKNSAVEKAICKTEKLHVIYNGIDFDEHQNSIVDRIVLNIPEDAFVVGMVGRICKQKAPDTFVKMAGEICKDIDNAYFIIVGDVLDGNIKERKKIENLANSLGVNLMITGWVDNPLDYIYIFDIACLLSRWEGFGLVIPEYMYCKKPIVATRVDAIPYLITDKENGILVDVDDYKAAANAVIQIKFRQDLKVKLVKNAVKDVIQRFDAKRVSKETCNLISQLLMAN